MTTTTTDVAGALARVTGALPAAEDRPGQVSMAAAVARAVEERRPLVVQAGTGTGKSLAYLVPAALSGRRVVVATATKALQDQLAGKDLPFVAEHLDRPFGHAVLKGRSNYVCLQRVRELSTAEEQLELGLGSRSHRDEVARLVAWAATTADGDRAGLPEEPSAKAWAAVSVGARECPGAARCPSGEACFAEAARARAEAADVVVVNTHLYGLDLAAGGGLLPEHDVVVIDEAHALEDVVSATFGVDLGAGRFAALAAAVRRVIADDELVDGLTGAGEALGAVLADAVGRRVRGSLAADLAAPLTLARGRVDRAAAALRNVDSDAPDVVARRSRAQKLATALAEDLDALADVPPEAVAWVEGPDAAPTLRVAPVDVAAALAPAWERVTPVLTSATIPPFLAERLGLPADRTDHLDAGSPFDYARQALLYCAAHLPDPRTAAYEPAMHDELEALVRAAEGRTLALFTSYRAMDAAADAMRGRLPWPVLSQRDLPKPALLAAFAADPHASLFATMGFWQGVDVPGPSLALVAVDRLPFPRPDEPLLQARRERARQHAFRAVDLPRAATLLAQAAGRLVRTATDRGVVAVLDPRLATGSYRWEVVNALPPMRRTRDRAEAEALLRTVR